MAFFRCSFLVSRITFHIVVFVFVCCFTEMNILCDEEYFSAVCWRFSVAFLVSSFKVYRTFPATNDDSHSRPRFGRYLLFNSRAATSLAAVPPPARPIRNRLRALGICAPSPMCSRLWATAFRASSRTAGRLESPTTSELTCISHCLFTFC